jgi:acyl-CoA thioester hydrolase
MAAKDVERRKWNFPFRLDQSTRWLDNDMYSHLNNSVYPLLADSINNTYLIDHCGIEPAGHSDASKGSTSGPPSSSSVIGLVISSSASYYAPASFPNRLQTGLRVIHLGGSSVQYEVGIFEVLPEGSENKSSSMSELNGTSSPHQLAKDALACCIVRTTHVFVDRVTRRPVKPMPKQLHEGLSRLMIDKFTLDKDGKSKL